jgi:PAS domain S-box-containing protein
MLSMADYRVVQRDYLLEISRAINAQLDLEAVLGLVVRVAVEIVAGNHGFIALHDTAATHLRIAVAHNLPAEQWAAFDPLLAALEQPNDVAERAAVVRDIAEQLNLALRQMVSLPLLVRGQRIGVIVVFRAAVNVAFTPDDRALLETFAEQAAIAVNNARLYQGAVQEQQRLATIIEQSADGIMILDWRWRITTFNRAMELLTGWSRAEAIGRPCAEVLGIQNEQGVNICLVDCPLQRLPHVPDPKIEGKIVTHDGRERYIASRYSPQYAADGTFLGAVANVRDVTARKLEEQQQATFISVVGHELKTPVAIIKGYASTLRRPDANWDASTLADGLAVIEDEADRLNGLISNLLDVSRVQAGGLRLQLQAVDLPALAQRVAQGIAATVGDEYEFQLRFAPNFPPVHADEERLRMVLSNLIGNAVKYSPNGGIIRVGGWADEEYAVVYVADQGIGIAPEDQARIFDRFFRVDNALSRRTQGAGLGLYLVRAIVQAHGGSIRVESQPHRGARFVFTVPFAPRSLPDIGNKEQAPKGYPGNREEQADNTGLVESIDQQLS